MESTDQTIQPRSSVVLNVALRREQVCVGIGLQRIIDIADTIPNARATVRLSNEVVKAAKALLQVQCRVEEKLEGILPSDCTKYAFNRITALDRYKEKCYENDENAIQTRTRFFELEGVRVPLPSNKQRYTAIELCEVLELEQIRKKKRKVIFKVVEMNLVPVTSPDPIYKLLREFKKNKNVSWKRMGRPPTLDGNQLVKKIKRFQNDESRALSPDDISVFLKQQSIEKARENGLSTMMIASPSKKTRNNYFEFGKQILGDNFGISQKPQQKCERRYTAERSLRNVASYIAAVATSHYQIGPPDPRAPKINDASDGAKLFYNLIKKENDGLDITAIFPFFISSTDDTTLFAFEGTAVGDVKVFLIDKRNDHATRSNYTQNNGSTDGFRGLRVRHSVTMTAAGHVASIHMLVYGLTEKEMPRDISPTGIIFQPIVGLCYGGAQDSQNTTIGHVVFMRTGRDGEGNISNDQVHHERYRNEIFLPFVEGTRRTYLGSDGWSPEDAVENEALWVGWMVRLRISTSYHFSPPFDCYVLFHFSPPLDYCVLCIFRMAPALV